MVTPARDVDGRSPDSAPLAPDPETNGDPPGCEQDNRAGVVPVPEHWSADEIDCGSPGVEQIVEFKGIDTAEAFVHDIFPGGSDALSHAVLVRSSAARPVSSVRPPAEWRAHGQRRTGRGGGHEGAGAVRIPRGQVERARADGERGRVATASVLIRR